MSLQSAIERMTVGDESGMIEFVDLTTPRLKCCAKRVLCQYAPDLVDSDPEDIVQDVHLQFWVECRTGRFIYQCDGATWVYLHTKILREIRTRFGRGRMWVRPRTTESLPERDSPSLPPDAEAALREQHGIVQAALDELSSLDREVLMLRYFQALSWDAIVERTQISSSAAAARYQRARRRLREILVRKLSAEDCGRGG